MHRRIIGVMVVLLSVAACRDGPTTPGVTNTDSVDHSGVVTKTSALVTISDRLSDPFVHELLQSPVAPSLGSSFGRMEASAQRGDILSLSQSLATAHDALHTIRGAMNHDDHETTMLLDIVELVLDDVATDLPSVTPYREKHRATRHLNPEPGVSNNDSD